MSKEFWKEAIDKAQEQLDDLRVRLDALDFERAEITQQILQLEQAITGMIPLTSERPLEKLNAILIENATEYGLADACREVLKKNDRYMTPIEIRDTLSASGFDLTNYSNPLASIHGVLKRLVESGDAEKHESEAGTRYKWKPRHNYEVLIPVGTGAVGKSATERMAEAVMNEASRRADTAVGRMLEQKERELEKARKRFK